MELELDKIGIVLEQDAKKVILQRADLIVPDIGESEITEEISKVVLLDSGKLEFESDEKLAELGVTKTELLTTSDNAFFRTNLEYASYEIQERRKS